MNFQISQTEQQTLFPLTSSQIDQDSQIPQGAIVLSKGQAVQKNS